MLLLSLRRVAAGGAASHREQIWESSAVLGKLPTLIIELFHVLNLSGEGVCDERLFFLVLGAWSTLKSGAYAVILDQELVMHIALTKLLYIEL